MMRYNITNSQYLDPIVLESENVNIISEGDGIITDGAYFYFLGRHGTFYSNWVVVFDFSGKFYPSFSFPTYPRSGNISTPSSDIAPVFSALASSQIKFPGVNAIYVSDAIDKVIYYYSNAGNFVSSYNLNVTIFGNVEQHVFFRGGSYMLANTGLDIQDNKMYILGYDPSAANNSPGGNLLSNAQIDILVANLTGTNIQLGVTELVGKISVRNNMDARNTAIGVAETIGGIVVTTST